MISGYTHLILDFLMVMQVYNAILNLVNVENGVYLCSFINLSSHQLSLLGPVLIRKSFLSKIITRQKVLSWV